MLLFPIKTLVSANLLNVYLVFKHVSVTFLAASNWLRACRFLHRYYRLSVEIGILSPNVGAQLHCSVHIF